MTGSELFSQWDNELNRIKARISSRQDVQKRQDLCLGGTMTFMDKTFESISC